MSNRCVYKYNVTPGMEAQALPKGAEVLHVGPQGMGIFAWALVDPDAEPDPTNIVLVAGTGHPIPDNYEDLRYVNTFMLVAGQLVFHAFQARSQPESMPDVPPGMSEEDMLKAMPPGT